MLPENQEEMKMYYAKYYENRVPRYWNGFGWTNRETERTMYPTMKAVSQSIHETWQGQKPKNHSAGYNILRADGKPLTDKDYKTA
jgi:hypothetical protein